MSGLNIEKMDIASHLRSKDPQRKEICFIHGEDDSLIHKDHAQRLYDGFKGRKMLICFEGTHNSSRPDEVIKKCFNFIEEGLRG
jgi:dipeptidyl aminopeptidase/acylaminoacyl peptidase